MLTNRKQRLILAIVLAITLACSLIVAVIVGATDISLSAALRLSGRSDFPALFWEQS